MTIPTRTLRARGRPVGGAPGRPSHPQRRNLGSGLPGGQKRACSTAGAQTVAELDRQDRHRDLLERQLQGASLTHHSRSRWSGPANSTSPPAWAATRGGPAPPDGRPAQQRNGMLDHPQIVGRPARGADHRAADGHRPPVFREALTPAGPRVPGPPPVRQAIDASPAPSRAPVHHRDTGPRRGCQRARPYPGRTAATSSAAPRWRTCAPSDSARAHEVLPTLRSPPSGRFTR